MPIAQVCVTLCTHAGCVRSCVQRTRAGMIFDCIYAYSSAPVGLSPCRVAFSRVFVNLNALLCYTLSMLHTHTHTQHDRVYATRRGCCAACVCEPLCLRSLLACWRAGVSRWPERTRARVRVGYRQIAPHRVAAVRQDNLSARRYGRMCGGSLHGYCVCVCARSSVRVCVPSFWQ